VNPNPHAAESKRARHKAVWSIGGIRPGRSTQHTSATGRNPFARFALLGPVIYPLYARREPTMCGHTFSLSAYFLARSTSISYPRVIGDIDRRGFFKSLMFRAAEVPYR
jgi:hypothetical protein